MGERDEQRLAQLLRQAGPAPLNAATAQDVFERAWEAVRAGWPTSAAQQARRPQPRSQRGGWTWSLPPTSGRAGAGG